MTPKDPSPFPSAREDKERVAFRTENEQTRSPSYRLAYADPDFILSDDLRPVRLQLELMKPELLLREQGVRSTVAIFGSARIPDRDTAQRSLNAAEGAARATPNNPALARRVARARRTLENSRYYEEARKLAAIVSATCAAPGICDFVILTGGGPGIMEAANRGAADVEAKSVGLNIVLPHEQAPNAYVTPELCFRFHYFAIRKMHFLQRAKALVFFPGGFGTLDEMFEAATLMQTGKIERMPFILFGREFWERLIDLPLLVEEGLIADEDLRLFQYVETAEEAWTLIADFWKIEERAQG
jgi:uncharacterized protein (TIGR00730 family)